MEKFNKLPSMSERVTAESGEAEMKFRKKPVVIDAFQWRAAHPQTDFPAWAFPACSPGPDACYIDTLEGRMRAEDGDWIIKGVKDEVYPCKPDIFEATYEPVSIESLRERAANVVANDREQDSTKSTG